MGNERHVARVNRPGLKPVTATLCFLPLRHHSTPIMKVLKQKNLLILCHMNNFLLQMDKQEVLNYDVCSGLTAVTDVGAVAVDL